MVVKNKFRGKGTCILVDVIQLSIQVITKSCLPNTKTCITDDPVYCHHGFCLLSLQLLFIVADFSLSFTPVSCWSCLLLPCLALPRHTITSTQKSDVHPCNAWHHQYDSATDLLGSHSPRHMSILQLSCLYTSKLVNTTLIRLMSTLLFQ